ncbi:sulfotransferase [Plakobranchus ocellatus]|uniref:Sulfotransferase n=1 Tax=Plakobranchus ocellatus TaxID=259542 RepID=A0AAV4BAE7_9GAST|nr:sulfotransferase [Plakobranchus ocellatus]
MKGLSKSLRSSPKRFVAVLGLSLCLLLVSKVSKFHPSGDLALYIPTRQNVQDNYTLTSKAYQNNPPAIESGRADLYCKTIKPGTARMNGWPVPAISLQHLALPRFLPDYKNPCWWSDSRNSSISCLPYVYLAGFPKCGTTDLYFRLIQHPLIVSGLCKEPHYLTRFMYLTRCNRRLKTIQEVNKCNIGKYSERYFEEAAQVIKKNRKMPSGMKEKYHPDLEGDWQQLLSLEQRRVKHPIITVDGSASTAWDNRHWRAMKENQGCPEPVVGPAHFVTRLNNNVRVILLLRDPVDSLRPLNMELDAIKQLADAIREQTLHATQATTTTVSSVSAVAFKAPQFWQTNAKAWFIRLEASFNTHTPPITQDLTKFHHVIQLLDSSTACRAQAVLENPPPVGKYDSLKSALLNAYEATQLQKDQELLNLNGLGDRKPSELLQHMRSLNHDPGTLFRALFLNQLPPDVRRILAQTSDADLDTLAKTADGIMDVEFVADATRSVQNTSPIEVTHEEQANSGYGDVNALKGITVSDRSIGLRPLPQTESHQYPKRLYSDYVYFSKHQQPSKEDFHRKVLESVSSFKNCTSHKPLRLCLLKRTGLRLNVGMYHVFVSDWLTMLPRSRLLVLHSETYKRDVPGTLTQVFRFLDLLPISKKAMDMIASIKERNRTKKKNYVGAMLPETKAILRGFYTKHNEILAKMLQDDRFSWRPNT